MNALVGSALSQALYSTGTARDAGVQTVRQALLTAPEANRVKVAAGVLGVHVSILRRWFDQWPELTEGVDLRGDDQPSLRWRLYRAPSLPGWLIATDGADENGLWAFQEGTSAGWGGRVRVSLAPTELGPIKDSASLMLARVAGWPGVQELKRR